MYCKLNSVRGDNASKGSRMAEIDKTENEIYADVTEEQVKKYF